ncbi:hypothetical protein JG687_00001931 [Phytophthora cactorum]|uniref:Uncharacterized protein n=1 Tax=Phytophthora cactorum TaxID=29920 RepID=A0A329SGC9_9STRA|nr:hypothetical protein Pcac1_g23551 [Phytophthora cactorum]KAG3113885.1 hypothetical protein PI125_g6911 [Phytophthora idaei]KAG2828851.1 hypothetical protein PC112_g8307 [Phytophthora cactorum]KAG2831707.1 hypothetical protein PC111_g6894 [Phytophthora cactorum]KAG2936718.1 hypothetical protein PC114_g145 [Phytophthora cactorum]
MENYKDALKHDVFFNHVKAKLTDSKEAVAQKERKQLLEEKFSVVGGSARLMFAVKTEEAMESLLEAIAMADDVRGYIGWYYFLWCCKQTIFVVPYYWIYSTTSLPSE